VVGAGEIDLKGCAVSGFAVDEDVSGALLDDAVNGSQAQAGSLPCSLVVKKGSKMRDTVASSMPVPVSLTASRT